MADQLELFAWGLLVGGSATLISFLYFGYCLLKGRPKQPSRPVQPRGKSD
jgi:hypothetical protein